MYIYYCNKCQSFESFVGVAEEYRCKDCGNDLLSLGVTIDDWNAMSEEDMMRTIEYSTNEALEKSNQTEEEPVSMEPPKDKPDVRTNLMMCPQCFKEISKNAEDCPHCKHHFENNPKAIKRRQKNRKIGIILTAIGAVCMALFAAFVIFVMGRMTVPAIKYGGCIFGVAGIVLLVIGIIKIVKSRQPKLELSATIDEAIDMVIEN